jgi:predicted RNA-binding protein Jag
MNDTAQTVTTEGSTLSDAIQKAAAQLGVPATHIEYKFDHSHFRSAAGRAIGVDTVRVICWSKDPATVAAALAGRDWLKQLLEGMGMRGEVEAVVSKTEDKACELRVRSEDARFLVGRQGTTLRAIQELLEAAMGIAHPEWRWRVDVDGGERRERRDDLGDRGERRERRDDRGERRETDGERRDRRDRPDRGADRGERRGDRRDRPDRGADRGDRRRTDEDAEKLRRLALRLAEEVRSSGEPTELRRELNSFERRIVHMAVSEVDGVYSESIGDGPVKQVRILPASARGDAEQG